ncbi:MAG: hypothetical protein GQ532_04820 [Methylomarinum sp.]|nr:hypothetical protein [Methylomarinum sp.]
MREQISELNVSLIQQENTRVDGLIDLDNPFTLSRLVECLLYSCVTDDTLCLYDILGQTKLCSQKEAMSAWVKQSTRYQSYDNANLLFNSLAIELDALLYDYQHNGGDYEFL